MIALAPLSMVLAALWVARRDDRRKFEQSRRPTDGVTASTRREGASPFTSRRLLGSRETPAGCNRRALNPSRF